MYGSIHGQSGKGKGWGTHDDIWVWASCVRMDSRSHSDHGIICNIFIPKASHPLTSARTLNIQATKWSDYREALNVNKREEVEILWEKGLLGDTNPQSVVDIMLFTNASFLFSPRDHQLRFELPQIQVFERPGERLYLQYTQDISRNHWEGFSFLYHANLEKPLRCFVVCKSSTWATVLLLPKRCILFSQCYIQENLLASANLIEPSVECVSM